MRNHRTWRNAAAALLAGALVATACGDDNGDPDPGDTDAIATGTGVTAEPCPNAVNPDNGCIYLGILSDLTEGPFAALAVPLTEAQEDFWKRVNEAGGIAGYDVDVATYQRDNKYNDQEHVTRYQEIEPNILALAQSLGTPPTLQALGLYEQDKVVAAPASWWSGWGDPDTDKGLILESGYSYCIESMNGLDWYVGEGNEVSSVMAVGYPGDYGGDGAAGVEIWAEANEVEFAGFTQTGPNSLVGNQDGAVGAILAASPDVVQLGVGPGEMAEIVGKAAAQGFTGQFLGSVPTYNPVVLQSDSAPAILALYKVVGPWGPFGTSSAAHDAMAEALGGELPANDGYTFGWIWQYPMKALLERAAELGDLTRDGLLAAVEGLEVDYEGALPTRTITGDPNTDAVRQAVISQPSTDAPLGLELIQDFFTGPTAEAYEFTGACAAA